MKSYLAAVLILFGEWMGLASESRYCIIDLSGGASATSYNISAVDQVPSGGWTDEYKTTKLVLRKIDAGTFQMGGRSTDYPGAADRDLHQVTLSKPFYIGVFEVTQRQWELVMGSNPSYFNNSTYYATRPVEKVSRDMIRGKNSGRQWPGSSAVDATSFIGKLRQKTGLDFDLPTEAQWEYACRANTTTALNNGIDLNGLSSDSNMGLLGRYYYNGGSVSTSSCSTEGGTAKVGSYASNDFGLYDMHGNVLEWCLDRHGDIASSSVSDPQGPSSGSFYILRGGGWCNYADRTISPYRDDYLAPQQVFNYTGLRLARTLSDEDENQEEPEEMAVVLAEAKVNAVAVDTTFIDGTNICDTMDISYATVVNDSKFTLSINEEEVLSTVESGVYNWKPTELGTNLIVWILGDKTMASWVNVVRPKGWILTKPSVVASTYLGDVRKLQISTDDDTEWNIDLNVDWVKISAMSGKGPCEISISFNPYGGQKDDRSGVLRIDDNEVVVVQHPFDYDVSPDSHWAYGNDIWGVAIDGMRLYHETFLSEGKEYVRIVKRPATAPDSAPGYSGDMIIPRSIYGRPVAAIGDEAFQNCDELLSLSLPDGIVEIGVNSFAGCSSLASLILPTNVTSIGSYAFSNCSGVQALTIPQRVVRIGAGAFSGCSGLQSMTIPKSVESLGAGVFANCWGLNSLTLPFIGSQRGNSGSENALLGYLFRYTYLEGSPNTIEQYYTPTSCLYAYVPASLQSVVITDETTIGYGAFSRCKGLVSVQIPQSVVSIDERAFYGCSGLKTVYVARGDVERVKGLMSGRGVDITNLQFAEVGDVELCVEDDADAVISGNAGTGYIVRPSSLKEEIVVNIPDELTPSCVTVVVGSNVKRITPNGAKIQVIGGNGYDITELLNIPNVANGVIDLTKATVKESIVKEAMDPKQGAIVEMNAINPLLATPNTRNGLLYTLREGTTLGGMTAGDSIIGNGQPWTPTITVKGGKSAFYTISVGK